MFKTFWFARRKPGLSWQEFRDHYENNHIKLGEQAMKGEAIGYIRHYLHPVTPGGPEPIYDFVMELCFPDRASYDRMVKTLTANKALSSAIAEDEAKFLDRSSIVHYAVEDVASNLKS